MKTTTRCHRRAKRVLDNNEPRPGTALHVLAVPLHYITERIHFHSGGHIQKRHLRFVIGGIFMVTGAGASLIIGEMQIGHVMHVICDVVAWTAHGIGSTPYATWVVKGLELE